jgi:rhodanese-related sulfurtransferase
MKWLQFLTPVASIDWQEAEKMLAENAAGEVILLDVRQPSEYTAGHRPGAKLLPLGELENRLQELPQTKPIIIY